MRPLDCTRDWRFLLPVVFSGSASAFARTYLTRDIRRSRQQRGSVSHPQSRPLALFTTVVLHETTQHWPTGSTRKDTVPTYQVVTCPTLLWSDVDTKAPRQPRGSPCHAPCLGHRRAGTIIR